MKDKVTNAAVRDKVNRWKNVMNHVKETKIPVIWSHMSRMSDDRLVNKVMIGMVGDSRLQGRPPTRWSDDITEWYAPNDVTTHFQKLSD